MPGERWSRSTLAWCYYFGGELARALEQSRTTLERFPDSLVTWYVLGLSYLSLGQVHEGISALEKATTLVVFRSHAGKLRHPRQAWAAHRSGAQSPFPLKLATPLH